MGVATKHLRPRVEFGFSAGRASGVMEGKRCFRRMEKVGYMVIEEA